MLCNRCEQCSSDIFRKLASWGVGIDDARMIVGRLIEDRFLDDARFARAYCYDKFNFSGWGRRKIMQGLWAKHISRDLITDALNEIDSEEYEKMARRVIASRVSMISDALTTREGRNRLLRFAVGRGYEMGMAIDVIRSMQRESEDGEEID